MDSADQTKQTLVYADGYPYTEVFQAPELSGKPGGKQLISVFHAFFTADSDLDLPCKAPGVTSPQVNLKEQSRIG